MNHQKISLLQQWLFLFALFNLVVNLPKIKEGNMTDLQGHILVLILQIIKLSIPRAYFYWSLCDATDTYSYYSLPYTGKPEKIDDEPLQYYITGTNEYTNILLMLFCKYNKINNIGKMGIKKNFTIVGTIVETRLWETPIELKSMEGCSEKFTKFTYCSNGEILLVSMCTKKIWKKNCFICNAFYCQGNRSWA